MCNFIIENKRKKKKRKEEKQTNEDRGHRHVKQKESETQKWVLVEDEKGRRAWRFQILKIALCIHEVVKIL
jgi:hypothetical protein